MSHCQNFTPNYSRRDFLSKTSLGLGAAALATLIGPRELLADKGYDADFILADLDGDGMADIALTNRESDEVTILLNRFLH